MKTEKEIRERLEELRTQTQGFIDFGKGIVPNKLEGWKEALDEK